jgi:hypothetical protein
LASDWAGLRGGAACFCVDSRWAQLGHQQNQFRNRLHKNLGMMGRRDPFIPPGIVFVSKFFFFVLPRSCWELKNLPKDDFQKNCGRF